MVNLPRDNHTRSNTRTSYPRRRGRYSDTESWDVGGQTDFARINNEPQQENTQPRNPYQVQVRFYFLDMLVHTHVPPLITITFISLLLALFLVRSLPTFHVATRDDGAIYILICQPSSDTDEQIWGWALVASYTYFFCVCNESMNEYMQTYSVIWPKNVDV